MKVIDYTDERGRTYRVEIPDGVSEADAPYGVLIGPPDVVDSLGLPEAQATRLHNELHRRGLYRLRDVRQRPGEVTAALMAALRCDVQRIVAQYDALERME